MAYPRLSLPSFLSHAKASLQTAILHRQKTTIVIGNESADLDSLTSSILYAYIRSQTPPRNAFTPLYIPVLNIPRADISLRPEFAALFHETDIDDEHIITLNDLCLEQADRRPEAQNTRWILVDHNSLQGSLGALYSSRVHGVVDHHDEEHTVPNQTDPEPRIVEKCGSCTSLIVNYFQPSWDLIAGNSSASKNGHQQAAIETGDENAANERNHFQQPSCPSSSSTSIVQAAKFALASILIDTRNLTDRSKVQVADQRAVAYLEHHIHPHPDPQPSWTESSAPPPWNRTDFYNRINTAKENLSPLPLRSILRKDYKQWTVQRSKLGISSVVKPLAFLVAKGQPDSENGSGRENGAESGSRRRWSVSLFLDIVREFMEERDLAVYAIMTTTSTTDEKDGFRRELLLMARRDGVDAAARFERDEGGVLGLQLMELELELDSEVGGLSTDRLGKGVAVNEGGVGNGDGRKDGDGERMGGEESGREERCWMRVWRQADVSGSRKVVGPLLRRALGG